MLFRNGYIRIKKKIKVFSESVKYFSTEFMPLTSSGNIDIGSMSPQQKQAWQQPHTFYLNSKPVITFKKVYMFQTLLTSIVKTISDINYH